MIKRTPPASPATTATNNSSSASPSKKGTSIAPSQAEDGSLVSHVTLRHKQNQGKQYLDDLEGVRGDIHTTLDSYAKAQDEKFSKIMNVIKEIQTQNSEIKSQNAGIEKAITFLSEQYETMQNKLAALEGERNKDHEYILLLEEKVDELQRSDRKANIEIRNVPKKAEETKEDLINVVLNLAKTSDIKIQRSDIRDIFRTRGKTDKTAVITELSSSILKNDLLKGVKQFNKTHKNNKLNASHLGFQNNSTSVFVVEQLTQKANKLYYLARDLKKSNNYKHCWTSYGKVYMRLLDDSPIINITCEKQVHALLNKA